MKIIPGSSNHLRQILELNEGAIPHVNKLSYEAMETLAEQSTRLLVAIDEKETVAGFLLLLDESANYSSPNFQFFKRRNQRFIYVDRIVVSPMHARKGIGRRLYEDVVTNLASTYPVLTCEVNLSPPNPDSLAFHQRIGFQGVAEQETENGAKRVLLMELTFRESSIDPIDGFVSTQNE